MEYMKAQARMILNDGRSIATFAENLHYTQRDYLEAIPLQQIRLNPALTQNPGW